MTPVESPCVRNCCLDDKEICLGCFRSIAEIMLWGSATDEEKREILKICDSRREEQAALRRRLKL
jgi:predicted Fe-S protein YdhL (DUF1289 family)